mmetsp:Transcript_46302/g.143240  ORF Transcript_46302/g.143240 Transcript_46302/m.143240 type:complete len:80 (+) Transcript_46302:915-1154(+)
MQGAFTSPRTHSFKPGRSSGPEGIMLLELHLFMPRRSYKHTAERGAVEEGVHEAEVGAEVGVDEEVEEGEAVVGGSTFE